MLTVQWVFTCVHVALGVLMLYSVVLLEEKSFLKVFKPEIKEKRDEMVFVEDIESLKEREFKEMLMRASQQNEETRAIKVSGLCKSYKTQRYHRTKANHLVDEEKVTDINFTIAKNEIMGILGPSGAGKSSIFKMLTMVMSRSQGKIELIGENFDNAKDTADALTQGQIGIVYQDDVMWPELTVDQNLTYIGLLKGMEYEDIMKQRENLKRILYLDQHSEKQGYKLSGGNKRKLCSAMALMS